MTLRTPAAPAAVLALAALLAAAAVPAFAAGAVDPSLYDPHHLVAPPIGRIPPVHPERFVLPNGAVVFLLENHELPVVSGILYCRTSPALVPDGKVGLGGITGEVMRSGGTAAHPGDWLDDHLAAIGASLDAAIGTDLANSGFRCLADDAPEVIGLWAEMVREPAYPEDKIELAKVSRRHDIASRNDEMLDVLQRVARQAVLGKGSPYARQPEYATIEAITRDDCRRLQHQVFAPERAVLAVYGDFRAADMKKLLAARFGAWKRSGTTLPPLPPLPSRVAPRLCFAPKDDVTQSGIVVAQPGSRADDPDYASMQVLEQALGGGFSSRMMQHIRTARGLAYATGASAGTDFQRPGLFVAYSLTRSESTLVALDLVREEVRRITQAPLTPEELAVAKQAVVNGFVFNFEDPSQTLFRAAYYEAIGYPADFLDRYQKALDQVTAESVFEAARRKLQPDSEVVIVVGREQAFDRPLASAGLPVERVDIRIPPPPSAHAAVTATPEAAQQGRAWLDAAAKAAGGAPAWAAVKAVTIGTEATLTLQGQSVAVSGEESWAFPDREVATQKLPFGELRQGFDGTNGWTQAMGQLQDNPKAAEEVAKDWERSLWRLFTDGAVQVVALTQPETVNGAAYRAAAVTGARAQDLTLLFDDHDRLAGFAYQDEGGGQMGPARVIELYADWQPQGGLQYPRRLQVLRDGKPFLESRVTSLVLNPALADDRFRKPAK